MNSQLQESCCGEGHSVLSELCSWDHFAERDSISICQQNSHNSRQRHAHGKAPQSLKYLHAKGWRSDYRLGDHSPCHPPSRKGLDRRDQRLHREEPDEVCTPEQHCDTAAVPKAVPHNLKGVHSPMFLQTGQTVRVKGTGELKPEGDRHHPEGIADRSTRQRNGFKPMVTNPSGGQHKGQGQ